MASEGIGARVRRKEDERHLHGRGRFVGDIAMPGLKDIAFLRSSLAHARIGAITKPPQGDVLIASDFPGMLPIVTRSAIPGYKVSAYPCVADGKARFVGDILAVAVARACAARAPRSSTR